VLASREVWPFVEGGGIGRYVWGTARLLAREDSVSVVTSDRWRDRYEQLVAAGDARLPEGVRFAFAEEPAGDLSPFVSWEQLWSLRLLEAVARLYPDGGPDLLELPDYQAEGFAAAHARRGLDPRLRNTTLVIGLHTSAEMCAALDDAPLDLHRRTLAGLERFALRHADALLWPGGNSLDGYAEFYGVDSLAAAVRRPPPAMSDVPSPTRDIGSADGPLRLLYLNRLQKLKGIGELVAAVRSLPDAGLELTVVGRDTMTGPDGSSMREHVEELIAGDTRIVLSEQVAHTEVPALIAQHDAVVVPSHWEAFSYVVREALGCNRPVIATPVGGILDAVRPGESGWLARSSSPEDLAAALGEVLDERSTLAAMVAEGRPRAVFDEITSDERTLDAYRELLKRSAPSSPATPAGPAGAEVTAIVACDATGALPLTTLSSLERQRDASISVVLVAPPAASLHPVDVARARTLATTAGGEGRPAAWGAGLSYVSTDLVLLLPAGAVLASDFVARAAEALAREPGFAYVTSFAAYATSPWHVPLGSYHLPLAELDAAPSVALARRSVLDAPLDGAGSLPRDETELFAGLAAAGRHGLVLQAPLIESLPTRGASSAPMQALEEAAAEPQRRA
jgi:glycosyltransferase involved in cell wall biosynthesis